MQSPDLKYRVLKFIKCETGFTARDTSNPHVTSIEIEEHFNICGAEVRDIVRELRREGHPVAMSSKGYSYAKDYSEIKDTIENLRSRAHSLLKTASLMESNFNKPEQLQMFGKTGG